MLPREGFPVSATGPEFDQEFGYRFLQPVDIGFETSKSSIGVIRQGDQGAHCAQEKLPADIDR